MPSPDKYDKNYGYIIEKNIRYHCFLSTWKLKTIIIYSRIKKILKKDFVRRIDIYFYDDPHWSTWATQIIDIEIAKQIKAGVQQPGSTSVKN